MDFFVDGEHVRNTPMATHGRARRNWMKGLAAHKSILFMKHKIDFYSIKQRILMVICSAPRRLEEPGRGRWKGCDCASHLCKLTVSLAGWAFGKRAMP